MLADNHDVAPRYRYSFAFRLCLLPLVTSCKIPSFTSAFSQRHAVTSRYFRNYLAACVSIVDAFINRHIHIAKADGFDSPEFDELKRATQTKSKMELWWKVCCDDDPSPLFSSTPCCRFQELRDKRNNLVHALQPFGVYSLREIQTFLNKVQCGVGELMLLMRKAHDKPSLEFIERLRTAPIVDFHRIHFSANGDTVDKVDKGSAE